MWERRRQWHPTPVLLPGKSHGRRSLVGCHLWGCTESWLSNFTFTFHFHALEKEVATHSSVLAWRIPGTGSHRVGHDWSDLAAAAAVCEKLHRWTGRPGVLWFMGSQRVGHHWATGLNWTHGGQEEDPLLISAPERLTGYPGVKYTNTAIILSGDCSVRKCSDRAGTLTQPGVTRKADGVLRLNLSFFSSYLFCCTGS